MNVVALTLVGILLVAVLALLHRWQERIEAARRERILEEEREAQARGSSAPLAQHPQIDARSCIGCGACVDACPEEGVLALVDGVARVIHGARCLGHGLCADACPVGAVKIGLGELAKSPDLPALDGNLETSVPGVFIAGELGGLSLIKNAVEEGVRALDGIAADLRSEGGARGEVADVLIVGAGPAGFGAALRAIERRLRYVLIDQEADIGGTVRKYPRRKLTLTAPMTLPLHGRVERREFLKEELIALWEGIVARHGVRLRGGTRFLGLGREGDALVARTSTGAIAARRVLLALGRRGTPRRLGVPGEEAEKVLYELVDAASYEGERILVVGGGDSAAEAAIALAMRRPGARPNEVTLSYRRERFFRLKRKNEERLERAIADGLVRALLPSDVRAVEARSVTLAVGPERRVETIGNDHVLVLAGGDPPYPLLREVGIRMGAEPEPAREPAGARA
ncbi:MAG TPA: NAD(P)-binding domain-containing protein [Planctomycetota bacterium]|nr:NAD(P)-binding domain-containing protein [Planctomycetota bacterium]